MAVDRAVFEDETSVASLAALVNSSHRSWLEPRLDGDDSRRTFRCDVSWPQIDSKVYFQERETFHHGVVYHPILVSSGLII